MPWVLRRPETGANIEPLSRAESQIVPLSLEGRHWSAARRPKRGLEWRAAVLVEMVLASVWPKYAGHFLDDGIKMNAGLSHHG